MECLNKEDDLLMIQEDIRESGGGRGMIAVCAITCAIGIGFGPIALEAGAFGGLLFF